MDRRTRWGLAAWLLRPAYVVVELAVAAATTGHYSLADDTVSDLGSVDCRPAYCSPAHGVMNSAFVGFGLLLALGAVLLAPRLGRGAAALLVVAGTSSVGVGLAPVDQDAFVHTLVATPLFVAQPWALALLARREPGVGRRRVVAATAAVTAGAAVAFVVVGGGSPGSGLLERLALWPVLAALVVVALSVQSREHGWGRRPGDGPDQLSR